MAPKVLVIIGSVRPKRLSPSIAEWVAKSGPAATNAEFEVIDLKKWKLPADAEPAMPATGVYETEATKAWSKKVQSAAGFVFVTPEYNGGYPGALKNSIDHLFVEWKGKPAAIVSFGGHGGTRSSAQLKQILPNVGLSVVPTSPALKIPHDVFGSDGFDAANILKDQQGSINQALTELGAALK